MCSFVQQLIEWNSIEQGPWGLLTGIPLSNGIVVLNGKANPMPARPGVPRRLGPNRPYAVIIRREYYQGNNFFF